MIINLGDAPFKAFITVTYPSGKCTVKHEASGISYSHSDGGPYTFTVNRKGKWIVTATPESGADKTEEVEINTRGEVKTVNFSYELVLFADGKLAPGYSIAEGTYITPKIPMSQYEEMVVTAGCFVASAGAQFPVGVSKNPMAVSFNNVPEAYLRFSRANSETQTLKLTGINDDAYVGFWTATFGAGDFSINTQDKTIYFRESAYSEYYISEIVLR